MPPNDPWAHHTPRPAKNPTGIRTSQYLGVWKPSRAWKWSAAIRHEGVDYFLGCFEDEADAAIAYNQKAFELLGAKAQLNTVPTKPMATLKPPTTAEPPSSRTTLTGDSPMPFGQYQKVPLRKVPADYLLFLWDHPKGPQMWEKRGGVAEYIRENLAELEKSAPDIIVRHRGDPPDRSKRRRLTSVGLPCTHCGQNTVGRVDDAPVCEPCHNPAIKVIGI